jgi:farnesyl diphosphate synthase
LDCFGAPEVIGKIGTDIEDNKCSWLIVQALSRANPQQRRILEENYGRRSPENVARVKQVYKELDLVSVYQKYEEESYAALNKQIAAVDPKVISPKIFEAFVAKIYKRNK